MKVVTVKKISIVLLLSLCTFFLQAQTVTCDMTLLTTIEGFNVYRHNPSGAIMFRAKMYIDADGSPRAYGPNNSGLDWTANAGYTGNWWGVVTDSYGNPIIQGAGDPYPGMYVSTTSLVNSAYGSTNPLRYTNSETVPFYVLPSAVVSLGSIHIGDMGYVYNTATGLGCYAIYADAGPSGSLGEGSIYLAEQIGINSNPRTGGTSSAIIDYIVFPQSGYGQGTIPTLAQINTIGTTEVNILGGIGIVGCLDNPVNNPVSLQATLSGCPSNNVAFSWTNSGSNWHIDISTSSNFTNYFLKYVSNTTSCAGPAGFVDHTNGTTPLVFQGGTTYYWRVTNSNGSFTGPSFTIPACDVTPPATVINAPGTWQTQNFTANFTDTDNTGGTGIEKSFYQVLDYNGTEWHANAQNGFFADNYDSYNSSVWNVPASSGTWVVSGGKLIQTDTSVNNTNIYAALNQNLSNRYIYQFYFKMDAATSGTNQHRFGMHFFSDNASLTNRGNSYFIFFRQETSKLEFYKVVNDVYTQTLVVDNITTTFGQWYDIKVIFDRITGKIAVYRDDLLLGTWTDSSPLTIAGNYISFRTGHCKTSVDEMKVYRSRYPSVTVTVGAAATNDIRYQNPDPATYGAKIKSIVNDAAGNLSAIYHYNLNIDWTEPVCGSVNDGTGSDISTTTSLTTLSANWPASSDSNSGISGYRYAIGTSPGDSNVIGWTDNALNTSVTKSGLTLTNGQAYYFSVKTENGAGLINVCHSDGVLVSEVTDITENEFGRIISVFPNPFNENTTLNFYLNHTQQVKISLTDIPGREIQVSDKIYPAGNNSITINSNKLKLSHDIYTIKLYSDKFSTSARLIKY